MSAVLKARAGLLAACVLAAGFGAVGITDEGSVSLYGDTPRYLMNGAFIYDLVRDHPFFGGLHQLLDYTRLYYARYPALSLGHHPILLPIAEAPFFAVFGVSVMSARLAMIASLVAAVAFLYLLVEETYGKLPAFFAGAFLATSPLLVLLTQSIMSEIPALALLLATAYGFRRFCVTQRPWTLVAVVATAVASLYAKQLTAFVLPAFLVTGAMTLGVKRFLRLDMILAAIATIVLALPVAALTLMLSPTNVGFVVSAMAYRPRWSELVRSALTAQLTVPVLVLAGCGLVLGAVRRDRRLLPYVFWIASVVVILRFTGPYDHVRYTIYWMPPLAVAAASLVAYRSAAVVRAIAIALLVAALGFQTYTAAQEHVGGAPAYEQAARFVVESDPGATVLFSGDVDTGFFTFFVRKHDAARQLIVLRGDKVFTTSRLARPSIEDRITSPEEIYGILRKFGTRYVVIEDRPSRARVLEWVRDELKSANFVERKRIPSGSTDNRLRNTDIVVYEFLGRTAPDPSTALDMHLPLVRQSVNVTLADLLSRKYLR